MQFRQFSAHSRTCFIYTLKILRDIVLEYLNQTPNIPLFLLLDVEMETQEVQKDCQWWRRDTSHSGVSLSGSLDREKPRRRAKEGADLHFLYQPLFTHEHTYRCARLEEEPGWPQTLTLSHPHLSIIKHTVSLQILSHFRNLLWLLPLRTFPTRSPFMLY